MILGPSGSGKTTLAKRLSEASGCPRSDLDDVFWMNETGGYGLRRGEAERAAMVARLAWQDDWIVEGVYFSWIGPLAERADRIVFLDAPRAVRIARILARFARRRLGAGDGRPERLADVLALLSWDRGHSKRLRGWRDERRDRLPMVELDGRTRCADLSAAAAAGLAPCGASADQIR